MSTPSVIGFRSRHQGLPINGLQLSLCYLDGAFRLLSSGAVVREHIDQHKIGKGAGRLVADRAHSADCERPFGGVPCGKVRSWERHPAPRPNSGRPTRSHMWGATPCITVRTGPKVRPTKQTHQVGGREFCQSAMVHTSTFDEMLTYVNVRCARLRPPRVGPPDSIPACCAFRAETEGRDRPWHSQRPPGNSREFTEGLSSSALGGRDDKTHQ